MIHGVPLRDGKDALKINRIEIRNAGNEVTYRTRQVRHQSSPLTAVLLRADTAILSAFDLIEHDGEDIRNRPFLDRKNALARLLRDTEAGILFNEYIAQDGPVVFAHACWLGADCVVSKKVDST
jgi:ATP-dependent DNA ligase